MLPQDKRCWETAGLPVEILNAMTIYCRCEWLMRCSFSMGGDSITKSNLKE